MQTHAPMLRWFHLVFKHRALKIEADSACSATSFLARLLRRLPTGTGLRSCLTAPKCRLGISARANRPSKLLLAEA